MIPDNPHDRETLPLPASESFDPSILVLAALAVFVVWKLYSVLGVRTDREGPASDRLRGPAAGNSIGPAPSSTANAGFAPAGPASSADRWKGLAEPGSKGWAGLDAVSTADPSFDGRTFVEGAKKAYSMIVEAFAKGDRDTLHNLLSKDVFDSFAGEVAAREQRGDAAEAHPHGVIIGPDGAPWVTDGGLNAIVRVDPTSKKTRTFPLPRGRDYANLNTASFDKTGILWFTGQSGIYGVLDPRTGGLRVFDAPRGSGPYGITTTPAGAVFYASLAGSYLGRIDTDSGAAQVIEPPTPNQGARRVWSDSKGGVWVSEWNAGLIARYDSLNGTWQGWKIPGQHPMPYGIYIDERDKVWLSDWGSNAIWRFDPGRQQFEKFALPRPRAEIRQMAGRQGEVWAAESGTGHLLVIRFD